MDLEHSAQPQTSSSSEQPPTQKPVSDPPLPSMMTSLTNAAATGSGSSPEQNSQYPSLDAAIAINQPAAPTLDNLLASPAKSPTSEAFSATAIKSVTNLNDGSAAPSIPSAALNTNPPSAFPPNSPTAEALNSGESSSSSTGKFQSTEDAEVKSSSVAERTAAADKAQLNGNDSESQDAESETEDKAENKAESKSEEESSPKQAELVQQDANQPLVEANDGLELELALDSDDGSGRDSEHDSGNSSDNAPSQPSSNANLQVRIKRETDHLAIIFPKEQQSANPDVAVDFIDSELWQALQQRLSGSESFGEGIIPVRLYSQNCLLDTRQLQDLDEALGRFDLRLERLITSRRQTAVAAAMSGYSTDQTSELPELLSRSDRKGDGSQALAEPLYLQTTVRSGAEIRHPGSVVIMGDVNPGSSVIADGDILVWGRLRGLVHAGASGNKRSIIMALKMEPTQLRIAESVARAPAGQKGLVNPEVAHITPDGIRITPAGNFSRS